MWTLQRPNKGPDKKWRLNKESKYSSLLRPGKSKGDHTGDPGLPPPPPPYMYRTLDTPPDQRMVDPRMVDPRMVDPRMVDPRMVDPRMVDSRKFNDPRMTRTLDQKTSDQRAIYARLPEPKDTTPWKRFMQKSETSSSDSDEEIYPRLRAKSGWMDARKKDKDLLLATNGAPTSNKTFEKDIEPRDTKPLQELNGREKHVERFLASLENNNSSSSPAMEGVSRQRILSRSRDDLTYNNQSTNDYEDEDVWYDLDTLVKDHLHEILRKWDQIDDGIWAKAIVFEKNRRVAKAYIRAQMLTVNGKDTGFDGHRIGLRGFDNPMRDAKTLEVISRYVGPGVKIRMDPNGNVQVLKLSLFGVYVKPLGDENAIHEKICQNPNMALEDGKQVVFDIQKFEQNVNKELRRQYPNRSKLENQCMMVLAFSKPGNILQCPSWVIIINIVAMDMLRNKWPISLYVKVPSSNIKNRPRLPVPEEDPYTLTGGGSGASSGGSSGKEKSGNNKPPKLPPRDNNPSSNKSSSKGDYDSPDESIFRRFRISSKNNNSSSKDKEKKYDDPYYCGLRARVPKFANRPQGGQDMPPRMAPQYHPQAPGHAGMFHSRSVDSGMGKMKGAFPGQNQPPYISNYERNPCSWVPSQQVGYGTDSDFTESPYSHIYGRLPLSNRAYLNHAQMSSHGIYGTRDWD